MTSIGRPDPAQITAAAVPIRRRELRTPKGKKQLNAPVESLMWNYYREVPAIGNYVTVLSNTATNVAYYPGRIDPELSEPEQEENGPAVDLFEEVGGETAVSSWVSQLVKHLSVAGQAWFVPTNGDQELADNDAPMVATAPEGELRTKWDVFSTHDLKVMIAKEKKIPFSFDVEIDEDDKRLWRIWQPDPERKQDPDSPVRRTDDECEILVLIKRRRRADLLARLHAGLLFLPATLKNQKDDKGHSWADVLEEGLLASEAPGSIEQLVPLIAFVEPEEAAAATLLKLVVDDGAWLEMLNVATLEQLAIGLDAPPELTTGKASLNHWTAWLISDETYSQHLDPLILRILESLNLWWQSMLVSVKGMAPDEAVMHVLWRNPATAVARPDAFAEALELHDRLVISDDALLATADRDQSDKPDDAEVEARSARAAAAMAPAEEEEEVDAGDDGAGPPEQIAAATTPELTLLAGTLTAIDQELLIRLEEEAADQLNERRLALIATVAAAAAARGLDVGDPNTLPARLGHEQVNALVPGALAEAEAFDPRPFERALARGQAEVAVLTEAAGGRPRDAEADNEDRSMASSMLLEALGGALLVALLRPASRPTIGEQGVPGHEHVPVSAIRSAMDRAGGGVATADGLTATQGIGNGKRAVDDLAHGGIDTSAFQWIYGMIPRGKNFVPHLNLDGKVFEAWDDPVLEQLSDTWVGGSYWYPGDHRGCRCTFTRILFHKEERPRPSWMTDEQWAKVQADDARIAREAEADRRLKVEIANAKRAATRAANPDIVAKGNAKRAATKAANPEKVEAANRKRAATRAAKKAAGTADDIAKVATDPGSEAERIIAKVAADRKAAERARMIADLKRTSPKSRSLRELEDEVDATIARRDAIRNLKPGETLPVTPTTNLDPRTSWAAEDLLGEPLDDWDGAVESFLRSWGDGDIPTGEGADVLLAALAQAKKDIAGLPIQGQRRMIDAMKGTHVVRVHYANSTADYEFNGRVRYTVTPSWDFPAMDLQVRRYNENFRWGEKESATNQQFRYAKPKELADTFIHELEHINEYYSKLNSGQPTTYNNHSPTVRQWERLGMHRMIVDLKKTYPEFTYGATAVQEGIAEAVRMYATGFKGRGSYSNAPGGYAIMTSKQFDGTMTATEWRKKFPDLAYAVEQILFRSNSLQRDVTAEFG